MNPLENAIVISVDEKPSIQALERKTGYVQTSSDDASSRLQEHLQAPRHSQSLRGSGSGHGSDPHADNQAEAARRVYCIRGPIAVARSPADDAEVHVVLDNYSIHKKNADWLAAHPNVTFHYTPTSASWLNMVEIWFGILTRKALRGAQLSSPTPTTYAKGVEAFIRAYGPNAKPFIWRKREVKGSQLRDTIVNLRN